MKNFINKIIQYEENIFYLKLVLNNIQKVHLLNINTELFHLKIKNDMVFIDKTTQILYQHLLKNDKLITKDEQLHSIVELKQLYNKECINLIHKNFIRKSDFSSIIEINKKDIETIGEILYKIEKDLNKEDLTTNEELSFLFNDEENQEEA